MSRSLKIIITVSLLLNVVLITAIGTAYYKKIQLKVDQPVLSTEARNKIKNKIDIDKRQALKNMRQMKQKSEALKSIVQAEEFDRAGYDKAMNELLDIRDQMARERAQKMGQAMETLSVEERKKLSQSLARSLSKGSGKRQFEPRERFRTD